MTGQPTGPATRPWPLSSALVLGALPSAAGCARLHAHNVVCEWGLGGLAETIELVVSELVTNAVLATTGPDGRPRYDDDLSGLPVVYVRLSSDRVRIVVEVWDRSSGLPTLKHAEPDQEGGRGLMLVDALCERWDWGTVQGWRGKMVWAEVRRG
jgi:anti-sigma regulatory factor (Ser/Thr protein kinase)